MAVVNYPNMVTTTQIWSWGITGGPANGNWYATTTLAGYARIPATGTLPLDASGAANYTDGNYATAGTAVVTFNFSDLTTVTKTIQVVTSRVGTTIYGSDYNAPQFQITGILGTGANYSGPSGGFGYNQSLLSGQVAATQQITALQWNNLANDINKAYTHINGSSFPGYATISGNISYANLNTLITYAASCYNNRLTRAANQASKTQFATTGATRATAWGNGNTTITSTYTVAFNSAADMKYYFNQGGSFSFGGIIGTVATAQDVAWQTALNAMTTAAPTLSYASWSTLTTVNAAIYSQNFTYGTDGASDNITISARLDLALASATQIIFTVAFRDTHVITGAASAAADSVSAGFGYNFYKNTTIGAFTGIQPASGTATTFV